MAAARPLDGRCQLLAAAASVTAEGGPQWCAVKLWLGALTAWSDLAASLGHLTAVKDALSPHGPGPVLARALAWRASCLTFLGRYAEAIAEARQALSMARQVQDPEGEAYALLQLGHGVLYAGDAEGSRAWLVEVQRLDPAGVPGWVLREAAIILAVELIDAARPPRRSATAPMPWPWPARPDPCSTRARPCGSPRTWTSWPAG